jgi:hypothetical protein
VKKVVVVSLWGSSQFGCWRSDLIRKNPTYIIIHIYIYIYIHIIMIVIICNNNNEYIMNI